MQMPPTSLADKLSQQPSESLLPPVEVLLLIQQIIEALLALSPLPITLPLRPECIFLAPEGTVSIHFPDSLAAYPTSRLDILDYAPPEYRAGKPLTEQSLVYSLGIMLYELLAGHRPYLTTSDWNIFDRQVALPPEIPLDDVRPGLKPATYQLVHTCLRREVWGRYESLKQLQEAVQTAKTAESTPPSLWQKLLGRR